MGSQQITFLYDLIYSYFPYYFKKQSWNEEGIIQFIVSIHSFCVFVEEKKTTDCCCSKTYCNYFSRTTTFFYFLFFVRWCAFRSSGICCHASFKYKSFSRSFIYHRVNVYHPLQSICLHEFQYSDSKWNRFQTIITRTSNQFFFLVLHFIFFVVKFIMVCIFERLFLKELYIILFWCMERFELYDGDDVCMKIYELHYCKCTLWLHNTIVFVQ